MSYKILSTTCAACGKSAEAAVSQEDFRIENRFTGEWEWSDDATVKKHCYHSKNPIHLQNAGSFTISWSKFTQ